MYLLFIWVGTKWFWCGLRQGPPLPMARVMDVAHFKIIKSKLHIKNKYIGNFMYQTWAAGVFCILYSVFCILYCMLGVWCTEDLLQLWMGGGGDTVNSLRPATLLQILREVWSEMWIFTCIQKIFSFFLDLFQSPYMGILTLYETK